MAGLVVWMECLDRMVACNPGGNGQTHDALAEVEAEEKQSHNTLSFVLCMTSAYEVPNLRRASMQVLL